MRLTEQQPISAEYGWTCNGGRKMSQTGDQASATDGAAPDGAVERRRPGRAARVSPELLPLLRQDRFAQGILAQRTADDLAAARGIGLGVLFGVACWAAFGLLAWWLLAG